MTQAATVLTGFDLFWQQYPRHQARKDAMKAWHQIGADVDEELQARILADLADRSWPRDKQFVPLPATYLRGARYEDERGPAVPSSPANRWSPTSAPGGRIVDGHLWCTHDPRCSTDLVHIRASMAEQPNNGDDPGPGL